MEYLNRSWDTLPLRRGREVQLLCVFFIKHLWTKQPCLVASTASLAANGLVPIVTWHFQLLFQSTDDLYGFWKIKGAETFPVDTEHGTEERHNYMF